MEKLWNFPGGFGLTPTGSNGAGIETFLDNIPMSVTREVLQNSIDAHNPSVTEPVRVEFAFKKIKTADIIGVDELLEDVLPKAETFWTVKKNSDTLHYLQNFKNTLIKDTIDMLVISDYNTTGLNNQNFASLIEGDGYSEKADETSAGSKGIGKAAPFAASNLRMVFYNSKATQDGDKSAGVISFVSYEDTSQENPNGQNGGMFNTKYITQARGRLQSDITGHPIFDTNRTEYGTDLFVMGLKSIENWKEKIILAVINNFLVALHNNNLEVIVEGDAINQNTLGLLLETIKSSESIGAYKLSRDNRKAFFNTYAYYLALTSDAHQEFSLPTEWIDMYPWIQSESDGKLYLTLVEENSTRRVLQTRRSGMSIYERSYINGSIPFAGVFNATGHKLNVFLKRLENVNHDNWSADREDDKDRKWSEQFLKALFQWYKQKVEESFGGDETETIKAFGLDELLPMTSSDNGDDRESQASSINATIGDIHIKEKAKKQAVTDGDSETESMNRIIDSLLLGDGDTTGTGSDQTGAGGGQSTGDDHGPGDDEGTHGEDPNGDSTVATKYVELPNADFISMKLISTNPAMGAYRFIAISTKEKSSLGFSFQSVGENGSEYHKPIISARSSTGNVISIQGGKRLIVENIPKNQRVVVDFNISDTVRLKMKGIVYEPTS